MAAKWQWGAINIYMTDFDIEREVLRAELKKLDATSSTFHYFGAGSQKFKVKGLVIGTADRLAIETDAINNTSQTLSTPWGNIISCYIHGTPKFVVHKYAGGTIGGVNYTVDVTPMYDCDLEIIH